MTSFFPSRGEREGRPSPTHGIVLFGLGLLLVGGPAVEADAQDLPDADELIAAYVEAIGGAEAHGAPTSIRTTGTLALPGMGLEGEFELLQFPSVGSRMVQTISGIGEIRVGFDGEIGWSMNAMTGPSLMGDDELEQMQERVQLAATLRDRELVVERETVERRDVQGQECWRVRLTWASGRESFDCYSVDTGVLVASEDIQVSEMGEIPVTTFFSDYEDFNGMWLPTRLVQETMGMQQVMEVSSVVIDDAAPGELEPPPAIRTLLEGDPGR